MMKQLNMQFLLICCFGIFAMTTAAGQNLIINGDLQGGNPFTLGSATTDFRAGCLPSYNREGFYCYGNEMSDKYLFPQDIYDHTTGDPDGRMLIFDGFEVPDQKIWQQSGIALQASRTYEFVFWGHNREWEGDKDVEIDLYINGSLVETFTILTKQGWQRFSYTLSGYGPGTSIALKQHNGSDFEDFAIDDLSLIAPCLLVNGDFQAADPFINGDATSDFQLACAPTSNNDGYYCWGDRMSDKHVEFPSNVFDHTFGNSSGRMLIFDGMLTSGRVVWKANNVYMFSNTNYIFTFWAHNRFFSGAGSDVAIDLYINTTFVQSFTVSASFGWQSFTKSLTGYGPNTTIYLVQRSGGDYRDFAIDDISLCAGYIEHEDEDDQGHGTARLKSGMKSFGERNAGQIHIQPNPANDMVTITMDEEFATVNVQIMDLSGKVVLSRQLSGGNKLECDISHLEAGMYFVQTRNGQGISSAKLIKR